MLLKLWNNIRSDFWGTMAQWQNQRWLWLGWGAFAIFLEIFSWAFFQTYLRLAPCELCVYIRFSMVAIGLGALLTAINPKVFVLKLAGLAITAYGIVQGLIWNIRLEMENLRDQADHLGSLCSPNSASFPFGLKLDRWLPGHFSPQALCGEDSNWRLFGLNMPEWLFFVYAFFIALWFCLIISWFMQWRRNSKTA